VYSRKLSDTTITTLNTLSQTESDFLYLPTETAETIISERGIHEMKGISSDIFMFMTGAVNTRSEKKNRILKNDEKIEGIFRAHLLPGFIQPPHLAPAFFFTKVWEKMRQLFQG
jgi:hypothetical protein